MFGGGDYKFTPELSAGLHYGKLEDVYQQYYSTLVYNKVLGDQKSLKVDLRYSKSREDGSFRDLDNKAMGAMVTYNLGGHTFATAYQRMSGDDPFPYIASSDPTWSTSYRSAISPIPTNAPGKFATTTTSPASASPG